MPYTVNACFDKFNKEVVNLDANQVPKAITSRNALIGSMHSLSNRGLIPTSYSEKDIAFGSFARKTKIRPLDDIDLMICFTGCGGTWNHIPGSDSLSISMPATAPVLSDFRNEDGTLNSRKLIENIKSNLKEVGYYKSAELHRNQEAVTLQLSSYDWNFDIVPCFFATGDFYLIPDGNGNWKKTDPRIDQNRTTSINQAHDGKVLQLIRTMKYWKSIWWPCVSSYMFEQMILTCANFMEFNIPFSQQVCAVLSYLENAIMGAVADPKQMQGDLNTLDAATRSTLSSRASRCFTIANDARIFEIMAENNESAINEWRKVFGNEFPEYGK